jgi:hypothetical protein
MKNIEKYALLITDTAKEVFVVFLALAILLNYLINIAKKELKTELDSQETELEKLDASRNSFFNAISYEDITNYVNVGVIAVIRTFMKNSSRTSMFYFIYILCMYLFIQQVSKTKVFDKLTWSNIYNDFVAKTAFVFLFPFLVFTIFTLIYVTIYLLYKTMWYRIEWTAAYSSPLRWFINFLKGGFGLLFIYAYILLIIVIIIYSIVYASNHIHYIENAHRFSLKDFKKNYDQTHLKNGINIDMEKSDYTDSNNMITADKDLETLKIDADLETIWNTSRGAGKNFYLSMVNTIHYLVGGLSEPYKLLNTTSTTNQKVNGFRVFNVIILALLAMFIIFISIEGVRKVITFNIYSTFMLDLSKILTLLLCVDVDMKRIFSFLKILIAVFIIYNIRYLFQYVYFVFAVVVFIIMSFFILKELNTITIESCDQFNTS